MTDAYPGGVIRRLSVNTQVTIEKVTLWSASLHITMKREGDGET